MPVKLTSEQGFIPTAINNELNETVMGEFTVICVGRETQTTAETKIFRI